MIVLSMAKGCVNLIFGSYCKKTKTHRDILRYYGWELPGEHGGIWHEQRQEPWKYHLRKV
jgi:hypothetical protein